MTQWVHNCDAYVKAKSERVRDQTSDEEAADEPSE